MESLSVADSHSHAYVRVIDAREIAEALPFPKLITDMALALEDMAEAPMRMHIAGSGQREMLIMPAMSARFAGVKVLTINPANSSIGIPVIGGIFMLMDADTGDMNALIDASELTARRTAAVSALASRSLARDDARDLVILGTGHLAPYLAQAHCAVRPIRKVAIWGRSTEKTAVTCAAVRLSLPDVEVIPVSDLETAVRQSDIVSAATRALEPLIHGDWISQGTHVDLVGGYRPEMREIDDAGIVKSTIYVDSLEAVLSEAGDLRSPIERGIITPDAIVGDIKAILGGMNRKSDAEVTLFKSVGSAAWDLIAAELVWNSCGS